MIARGAIAAAIPWLVAGVAALWPVFPAGAALRVLDPFEDSAVWTPVPASGVIMKLSTEPGETGRALRVDFDFQKAGGYAVLHRTLDLALPANYRFTVRVRGATAPQSFEFKLIGAGGENVWWKNRRDFVFSRDWETVATRKRQIEFAWGPAGGGEMGHVAAIEFAITVGSGGKGTVWLDELTFEELSPPDATPPPITARASSELPAGAAGRAADGDTATAWRAAPGTSRAWLALDLGTEREFGGLALDWGPAAELSDYDVRVASEPDRFTTVRRVRAGNGGRDWLWLPECEARWIRIEAVRPAARRLELREVALLPIEFGSSMNRFYEAIAKESRRGLYPRGLRGEMQFWTVVGTNGGHEKSLLSEDGAVDLGAGRPSVEPFLWSGGRLWTWADVTSEQDLMHDRLPLPRVTWRGAPVELEVQAAIAPSRGPGEDLWLRYRVLNRSAGRRAGKLFLAIRPFQVNPPAQFLNTPGGVCGLREIRRKAGVVELDTVTSLASCSHPASDAFGAAAFDEGDITHFLAEGRIPRRQGVQDPFGHASAALAYPYDLAEGDSLVVQITCPVFERGAGHRFGLGSPWPVDRTADSMAVRWRRDTDAASVSLPASAREVERTLAAQLGWILVNRDGAALQPGSRAYARSWMRDGALTSSALLRWGRPEEVKAFLDWFAPYQYADGKVPCCVDRRGADPVPEHDSHGEFIYLAAEYFRHTGDRATIEKLWPRIERAAAYLDSLRSQRRGAEWRAPARREFFGILPPSISHEGYSAKPMHSYWDDFWALRGYEDAMFLARTLGHTTDARRLDASRLTFRRDFAASIAVARARHRITYVPGCADLGDFDAPSTTIALSPVQAGDLAPPGAIEATFERYWDFFRKRRDGIEKWEAFTPYEIRNIGAFVRLGWRERAHQLLAWFLDHRSPPGWAQWAEVVWNAPPAARFIGDLPHTWVGSDFVRSVLDMLAYERERDSALVVGAGVSEAWVREEPGVSVRNLHTWYGPLSYRMTGEGAGIRVGIGSGLRVPLGGIVIAPPGVTPRWRARVNGRRAFVNARGEVLVRALPATVVLTP